MTVVHTQYGPGEIVASDTVRGRMQYKVAGPGFEIWVDETKVPPQHLGWAPVDHDNSVDLPYNPDPQYPAIPGDVESTIQPIHEIDAEERLSPADSITFEHRRRDEGDNRGRPGPNPDLFAKGASYHYADYEDEGEFGGHPSDTDIPGGPPQGPSPGGGDDPLMLTLPEFLDEVTQVLQQHPEWAHRSLGDLMEDPEVLQSVASEQGPLEMGPPPPEQGPPESPSDEGESGSESEPSDEGESEDSGESSDEDSGESDEDSGENPFDKGEESDESDEDSDESEAKDESENSDESDDECTCDHDDDDDDDDGNPFAKESGYFRDDNWQTGQSEEPAFDPHESEYGSGGPSGFSDLHPAVQQQILDHFGIGAPMSESEVFENSGYNKHAPGYNPHRDYTRWESSVHEAIAPAVTGDTPAGAAHRRAVSGPRRGQRSVWRRRRRSGSKLKDPGILEDSSRTRRTAAAGLQGQDDAQISTHGWTVAAGASRTRLRDLGRPGPGLAGQEPGLLRGLRPAIGPPVWTTTTSTCRPQPITSMTR